MKIGGFVIHFKIWWDHSKSAASSKLKREFLKSRSGLLIINESGFALNSMFGGKKFVQVRDLQ